MKLSIGITFVLILALTGFSQVRDSAAKENSLDKGSWAVQVQIGSDFYFTVPEDVIISIKYHFSPKFALRVGSGFSANVTETDIDYVSLYHNEYVYGPNKGNSQQVFVSTYCLLYLNPRSKVNIFFGLGPRASYSHSFSDRLFSDGYRGVSRSNSWSAGLNGAFGAEWFPMKFLSLFAEYSLYVVYGKSEFRAYVKDIFTGQEVEHDNEDSDYVELRGNRLRFGLSIYF